MRQLDKCVNIRGKIGLERSKQNEEDKVEKAQACEEV